MKDPAIPIPEDDNDFVVPASEILSPGILSSSRHLCNDPVHVTCLHLLKKHHYRFNHDVTQFSNENQLLKCKDDGCSAYFLQRNHSYWIIKKFMWNWEKFPLRILMGITIFSVNFAKHILITFRF